MRIDQFFGLTAFDHVLYGIVSDRMRQGSDHSVYLIRHRVLCHLGNLVMESVVDIEESLYVVLIRLNDGLHLLYDVLEFFKFFDIVVIDSESHHARFCHLAKLHEVFKRVLIQDNSVDHRVYHALAVSVAHEGSFGPLALEHTEISQNLNRFSDAAPGNSQNLCEFRFRRYAVTRFELFIAHRVGQSVYNALNDGFLFQALEVGRRFIRAKLLFSCIGSCNLYVCHFITLHTEVIILRLLAQIKMLRHTI